MKLRKHLKNNFEEKQNRFIQSVEGIGDILVIETKRQKNKLVVNGLQKIRGSIEKLLVLKQKDPEKFNRFTVHHDFLKEHKKGFDHTSILPSLNPEKYLVGFYTPINQIVRVYNAATNSQNSEISVFAIYQIEWILETLASQENNKLFIEGLLRKLFEISKLGIKNLDNSASIAMINWYIEIVFNDWKDKNNFNLSYLELFDKAFYQNIRYIVSENLTNIFKNLVSSLIDNINITPSLPSKIWNYGHIFLESNWTLYRQLENEFNIEQQINELTNLEKDVSNIKELNNWFEKFNQLKQILETHFSQSQKRIASELEIEIKGNLTSQLKYNNLLEIVYAIGAYCLFKKKYSYIKDLWEFKQPSDSDSSWIGHDIVPNKLDKVIKLYLKQNIYNHRFDFWEGHHGIQLYFRQYFILLILRALQNITPNNDGTYPQIENINLAYLDIRKLYTLESSISELLTLSSSLKSNSSLLAEIGFDPNKTDELFNQKLEPYLNNLSNQANQQIRELYRSGNISLSKVEEFKEEVLKGFSEGAKIRNIFVHYFRTYQDKSDRLLNSDTRVDRFGINMVDEKGAFLDDWYIHYSGWGESYGSNLASIENDELFTKIMDNCKNYSNNDLRSVLSRFNNPESVLILTTDFSFWHYFQGDENVKPNDINNKSPITAWYEFNGSRIPIFKVAHRKFHNTILVFDKTTIGQFVQYSPLNNEQEKSLQKGIFYINVQSFSENQDLMKKFIFNPPEWLKKVGDDTQKEEHLKTRVLIQIFERFEIKSIAQIKGYKIIMDKK